MDDAFNGYKLKLMFSESDTSKAQRWQQEAGPSKGSWQTRLKSGFWQGVDKLVEAGIAVDKEIYDLSMSSPKQKTVVVGEVLATAYGSELAEFGIMGLNTVGKGSAWLVTKTSGLWSKPVVEEVKQGIGLTSRLNRAQLKDYLANIHNISREQLIKDLESIGLKFKGSAEDGKFMDFIDKQGNVRVKIHPPHTKTPYEHIHIYNKKGQDLSAQLSRVKYRSPEAHIQIAPDDYSFAQEYYNHEMLNRR